MQGTILEVSIKTLHVTLAEAALIGETVLTLARVDDLPVAPGQVLLEGELLDYTAVTPDPDPDVEQGTIDLLLPITVDLDEGDILVVSPIMQEKWATVELQADDDAVFALVPHSLWDRIPEGVREPEDQEYAIVDKQEGDWVVLDVLNEAPFVDGDYIDPATLPVPESVTEVIGAVENLAAEVAANTGAIAENTDAVVNAAETAFAANSLASTADGRVSMSDYEPTTEDVEYYATDYEGNLMRGTPWDVTNREVVSGLATLHITGGGMTMNLGEYIVVTNLGVPFDGTHIITAFTADTVSYEVVHADVALDDPLTDPPIEGTGYNTVILQRTEGSIWFTRTRARRNYVTNPSFETNVTDWAATQAFMAREVSATIISGTYTLKIDNNATPGLHYVTWNNGGGVDKQAAVAGQTWTASVYIAGVSGSATNGTYIELEFFDIADASLGAILSQSSPLIVDDWQRFSLTAVAPVDTAYVTMNVVNPNDSASWRIDGALLELSNILGRYFDGYSYDGSWDADVDNSPSSLAGGKIIRAFELDDGSWIEKFFTGFTLRDIDASTVTYGALDGSLIADNSIPMDKLSGTPMVASEALDMGDLINVHSVSGLFRMRKADADGPYRADGHVLAAVALDAVGIMYSHGYNPFMTDLTPGSQFLSITPGKVSSTPPGEIGMLSQRVGTATGATVLNVILGPAILLT